MHTHTHTHARTHTHALKVLKIDVCVALENLAAVTSDLYVENNLGNSHYEARGIKERWGSVKS